MSFIYSLIAIDPDIVLAEHTDYQGNFMQIMRVILQKYTKPNEKVAIPYDNYKIYLYNNNKIKFLVLTENTEVKEGFAFLLDLKTQLAKSHSHDSIIKLSAYQLDFKRQIQEMMIYYNSHPITCKSGENINLIDTSANVTEESILSIIDKESKIGLIVVKEEQSHDIEKTVFNIEAAVNEIKKEDQNTRSKGYLVIAGGITVFLILFYWII